MTAGGPSVIPRSDALLDIRGLSVTFTSESGPVSAVRNLDFRIGRGEVLALVGESGSGKSAVTSAITGLLPRDARVSGSVRFDATEMLTLKEKRIRPFRGRRIGTIFQNPATSLDPSFTVGNQLRELINHHLGSKSSHRSKLAREWLTRVGISDADRVLSAYPHQLSGGMRQRIMIAIACIPEPDLLIADEPTTSLDPRVQKQILTLLASLRDQLGLGILLITHDFGVVSALADRVSVLREGRSVETGSTGQILNDPQHPYTRVLIESVPTLGAGRRSSEPNRLGSLAREKGATDVPVLSARGLTKTFHGRRAGRATSFPALKSTDIDLGAHRSIGIVGESGSGKSTLASILVGLEQPDGGVVNYRGEPLPELLRRDRTELRRRLQIVFQDHGSVLNPRIRVGEQLIRPIVRFGVETRRNGQAAARAIEALELVGLDASFVRRFPHQLSGGQRQRVGIARALASNPEVVILDEPTSALDMSTQARIVSLLTELRERLDVTFIVIAHNLALIEQLADDVIVLDHGSIVDRFSVTDFAGKDRHAVTAELVRAVLPLSARHQL